MNNYDERRVASYKGKQVRSFDLFTKLILSRFYKISEKYFILKFIILFDFIHIATNWRTYFSFSFIIGLEVSQASLLPTSINLNKPQ